MFTRQQFMTSMIFHVFGQTRSPFESPSANRTQMRFPFNIPQLPGVFLFVFAEIGTFSERHIALIALVRFFVQVDLQVSFQNASFRKTLFTNRTDVI